MKTINYKGKGEHSVRELELIIEQQAEELHLMKSGQKPLIIDSVIVPKGTLSDFEKWLDKKGNESYCGLPSQYVLDKYKSLNAL
tara:strand:+ start:290 stop:541 length:252 start_codon:yes stop_codon:yes gene_type:complete